MAETASAKPAFVLRVNDTGAVSKPSAVSSSAGAGATRSRPVRKRTKTGCLTCRKRRIKCTEERPICNNCIKSKRECEGYSQPVVFKTSLGGWYGPPPTGPDGIRTLEYHNAGLPLSGQILPTEQFGPTMPSLVVSNTSPGHNFYQGMGMAVGRPPFAPGLPVQFQGVPSSDLVSPASNFIPSIPYMVPQPTGFIPPQQMLHPGQRPLSIPPRPSPSVHLAQNAPVGTQAAPTVSIPPTTPFPHQTIQFQNTTVTTTTTSTSSVFSHTPHSGPLSVGYSSAETHRPFSYDTTPTVSPFPPTTSQFFSPSGQDTKNEVPVTFDLQPGSDMPLQVRASNTWSDPSRQSTAIQNVARPSNAVYCGPTTGSVMQDLLNASAIERVDDDYYDVNSDDENELDPGNSSVITLQRQQSIGAYFLLGSTPGLISGPIDAYRPDQAANPLRSPAAAAIFSYFINYIGPGLSLYERVPVYDPRVNLPTESLPFDQCRGLWNFSIPMLALGNQGLLHAILAMSGLLIAKKQGASFTPSLRHYAFALKRLHQALGDETKRHDVATLVTALLLGYYEVTTGDHLKWSGHLAGARLLVGTVDYAGMSREVRRRRARDKYYLDDAAQGVLQAVTGLAVNYDADVPGVNLGDGFGDYRPLWQRQNLDLRKFNLYQDMFWWYCQQDTFQSIISGNHLLMKDYSRWLDCPPRGRLGDANNITGTHDHLILLLARVASFSARDRRRKLKMQRAGLGARPGGPPMGKPPTGGVASLNSLRSQPTGPHPGPTNLSPPPFYGMAPVKQGKMPAFYDRGLNGSTNQPDRNVEPGDSEDSSPPCFDETDSPSTASARAATALAQATQAALLDWENLLHSVNAFPSYFPPEFQPIDNAWASNADMLSPFGPPLIYQSPFIAVAWAHYHTCQILAHRAHPHMPPASMVAAGAAASRTKFHVNEIGRITAGIVDVTIGLSRFDKARRQTRSVISNDSAPIPNLNPNLVSALCEISVPLFCAGIQYASTDQRRWLVDRLHLIHVQTGWESAHAIVAGCQRAWARAGENGFGPPWKILTRVGGELVEDESKRSVSVPVSSSLSSSSPSIFSSPSATATASASASASTLNHTVDLSPPTSCELGFSPGNGLKRPLPTDSAVSVGGAAPAAGPDLDIDGSKRVYFAMGLLSLSNDDFDSDSE